VTRASLTALLALGALAAGCGDNLATGDDDLLAARGGTRLALQKYRYDDGTELAATGEFFDPQLHARCSPQAWADGGVRCVPVADDAEFTDAACTARIGVGRTIEEPTHFVGHDGAPAGRVVTGVFRAGAATTPPAELWSIVGGACVGPSQAPAGQVHYFAIGDALDAAALVAFHDAELGDGRLALRVHETDDGVRVPFGLRDRALGGPCTAVRRGDGSVACEPEVAIAAAGYFADPECSEPLVAAANPPALTRVVEPSGCASYRRVAHEYWAPLAFRRDAAGCRLADVSSLGQLYALAGPIELAALGRAVEDADRRLHRVVLEVPGDAGRALRFLDDRLLDTATGADCRPRSLRQTIRCLPASLAPGTTLFTAGCATPVPVVELPRQTCDRVAYASSNRPFQIRPIGDPVPSTMFRFDDAGGCQAYTGAPDTELHALGAAIDVAAFQSGLYFGERQP
jgi:hypothetical protein